MSGNDRVVVVGGGHAGLLMGLALAGHGIEVRVVEPMAPAAIRKAPPDGRTLALLAGSILQLEGLGLWGPLAPYGTPIRRVEVLDVGSAAKVDYREEDAPGPVPFGQGFENRVLRQVLLDLFLERAGRRHLVTDRVSAIERDATGITIRTEGGARLPAGLVIGADGRGSGLRKLAGIGLHRWSYGHSALGFIVRHPVDNGGAVLERMRKGGPLATLPLRADRTGITWVETPERAKALAEGEPGQLLAELDLALGHALGELELDSPVGVWPLSGQHADRYVAPRLALVGDAAHGVHPIHAQGFNMGIADVAALVQLIAARPDEPGSPDVLRAYERQRRGPNTRSIWLTHGLARLFTNELVPVTRARGAALTLLDRLRPLRRFAIQRGMRT
ncbi:MAG TPA: FAD-dependent monooxygenase [Geminicoccus sp.]|uniref:FAD-dependent monooxygenase n=1 Tax=Geminicoccus sp. TaxID=2024832 RepID=UPI002CA4CD64|nr:FAD-dependent monooxygenase [Geminicoccus sp.]HWL70959.1 FAD-dependent monooxygenase [Geminicoccus sp.]